MTSYGNLRGRILDAADMNHTSFADTTTSGNPYRLAVNASISGLYDLLISLGFGAEQMAVQSSTITLSTSTPNFDTPSDCYKPIKLIFEDSDGVWYDLGRFGMHQLTDMHQGGSLASNRDLLWMPWAAWVTSGSVSRIKYQVRFWASPPNTTGTMRIYYVPFLSSIGASDSDQVPLLIPPSWEDWIVYDCAAKLIDREERDSSKQEMRREKAEQIIRAAARERVLGDGGQMVDTSRRWK